MFDCPLAMIAGWGAISAAGRDVPALRTALRENFSGLKSSERFNAPRFQSSIVGAVLEPGEGGDDPAYYLAHAALREAVQGAEAILIGIPPSRLALVLSTTKANIEALERLESGQPCSSSARCHMQGDRLAASLAWAMGVGGSVLCVSVACISGLAAIQQGARLIQRDQADAVLVVGVDHLSEFVLAGFTALKALDATGCRPFDQERRGLTVGEAGAALVLASPKLLTQGIGILGWGGSNDANHLTGPSRDGSGLALAMRRALSAARLEPDGIDYINAHGTGTPYNDAMESAALQTVFGSRCPPFSGSKGMLGHTLGAAGVLETIICGLALQDQMLPGTPRLQTIAEGVPASCLMQPRLSHHLRRALKVNTGFGGVNAALILGHV